MNLTKLADETTEKLHSLWENIGLNTEERDQQLKELTEAVFNVYKTKVTNTESYIEELNNEISDYSKDVIVLTNKLEIEDFNMEKIMVGSLKEKIECLKNQKKNFTEKFVEKQKDLEKILALYCNICEELQGSFSNEVDCEFFKKGYDFNNITDISLKYEESIKSLIKTAETEKNERKKTVTIRVQEIIELIHDLRFGSDEIESSPLIKNIMNKDYDQIGLKKDALKNLDTTKEALITERKARAEVLKNFAKKITILWNRLKFSQKERDEFTDKYSGLGKDTLAACEKELKRLTVLKDGLLSTLIKNSKKEIDDLWGKCYFSESEKKEFVDYYKDEISDEILDSMENKIKELQNQYTLITPILSYIKKRDSILSEKVYWDEKSKDPNRFKEAGLLIKEEKFRKVLKNVLPAINKQIRQLIHNYGIFKYKGERYYDQLPSNDDEFNLNSKISSKINMPRSPSPVLKENIMNPPPSKQKNKKPAESPRKTPMTPRSKSKFAHIASKIDMGKKTPKMTPKSKNVFKKPLARDLMIDIPSENPPKLKPDREVLSL